MSLFSVDIRNLILDAICDAKWYRVAYNNSDGILRPQGSIELCPPKTAIVNEVSSTRGVDRDYGRSRKTIKNSWTFEAIVEWPHEVTCDSGEETLGRGLQLEPTDNYRAFVVDLVSSSYQHPVALNGAKGSKALFTFNVRYGRN